MSAKRALDLTLNGFYKLAPSNRRSVIEAASVLRICAGFHVGLSSDDLMLVNVIARDGHDVTANFVALEVEVVPSVYSEARSPMHMFANKAIRKTA